jgi:sialate O-acetylesterase
VEPGNPRRGHHRDPGDGHGLALPSGLPPADHRLVATPLPERVIVTGTKTAPLVRNSPGNQLKGFAICGADRAWVWAEARIVGEAVEVWSPQVPKPVAVRYAWAINPTCNLAGPPAGPFRTDDFPAKTLNSR